MQTPIIENDPWGMPANLLPLCSIEGIDREINVLEKEMKSKATAAVLAFFLGGFGADMLYRGYAGKAFIRCLFFWTLIPCALSIVNTFRYSMITNERFQELCK